MSFLDRFQGKIATVTAQGHLRMADGSEEIRVGPPKRKPQARASAPVKQTYPAGNNSAGGRGAVGRRPERESPKPLKSGRSRYESSNNSDEGDRRGLSRGSFAHGQATMPGQLNDNHYDRPEQGVPVPNSLSPIVHDSRRAKSSPRALVISTHNQRGEPQSEVIRGSRSPKDVNEARVRSEHDQLAFSRKARPVSYEPCRLSQYKKEKPDGYYELGKLQPDLNSEDLVQKRANMERIKAFSKNLRDINKGSASATKKVGGNNDIVSSNKPKSTRDKALEFAKRVPKPKAHRASTLEEEEGTSQQVVASTAEAKAAVVSRVAGNSRSIAAKVPRPINSVVDDDSEDDELSSELLELQQRHQQSRAQVDAIIGGA